MFVDVYKWIQDFQFNALRNGDINRLRLIEFQSEAWQYFETEPEHSLQILREARDLAEQLREPCWMLYYDSWIGECLNLYLEDFTQGIDHAMKTIVEIRKPQYELCAMLCRGYRIVIESYIYSDPVGYADKVLELIDYADTKIPIDYDTYGILKKRQSELYFALGELDLAIESATAYLERASQRMVTFHMAYAYEMLVHYAYLQGEFEPALEMIRASEVMARRNERRSLVAITQAWQALLLLLLDQKDEAHRYYQLATANMSGLGMATARTYYDALCVYNERTGNIDLALQLRDKQYHNATGRGGYYLETEILLKKARLQGRRWLDTSATIAQAKQVAQQLLKPEHFLTKLARVEDGDFDEHLK